MPEKEAKPDITIEEKSLKETPKEHSVFDERPYGIEENRHVFYWWHTPRGQKEAECTTIALSNFKALIQEYILRDDGFEQAAYYVINVAMNNSSAITKTVEIPIKQYKTMDWVWELGPHALMHAGNASQEKLREAILYESGKHPIRERTIYKHTGWREINGEMYFLTAAGAVGKNDISVEMDTELEHYSLLDPEGDPAEAIKASLEYLLIGPVEVTLPMWVGMYLAPLTEIEPQISAFTIWLQGESGSYKSTLQALAVSHFGDFERINLPARWTGTANRLEELLSIAKDLPFILDDFAPAAEKLSMSDMERKAERIIRSQGDRAGRVRMHSKNKYPRGLLLTSGEMLTSGYSRTARILTLEIKRGDTNTLFMSQAQKNKYQYCKAMTHYIVWLKEHWAELKKKLPARYLELRDEIAQELSNDNSDHHPRMPEITAGLLVGLETAVSYALDKKGITKKEADSLLKAGRDTFISLARKQAARVDIQRAGRQFLDYLKTMFHQGIVKFSPKDSDVQPAATAGSYYLGWYEPDPYSGDTLYYIDMKAAVTAIKKYTDAFVWNEDAVKKDLDIMKKIVSKDEGHLTKNIRIGKSQQRVVVVKGLD